MWYYYEFRICIPIMYEIVKICMNSNVNSNHNNIKCKEPKPKLLICPCMPSYDWFG